MPPQAVRRRRMTVRRYLFAAVLLADYTWSFHLTGYLHGF